jgi:hypothetical protein
MQNPLQRPLLPYIKPPPTVLTPQTPVPQRRTRLEEAAYVEGRLLKWVLQVVSLELSEAGVDVAGGSTGAFSEIAETAASRFCQLSLCGQYSLSGLTLLSISHQKGLI